MKILMRDAVVTHDIMVALYVYTKFNGNHDYYEVEVRVRLRESSYYFDTMKGEVRVNRDQWRPSRAVQYQTYEAALAAYEDRKTQIAADIILGINLETEQ
jgi:hypothetical protein